MEDIRNKLIEEIKNKRIKLNALGKVCGRIFKLEADDETYLNLTIGGLIAAALTAIGIIVVKAIGASQNMVIDGIEKDGNNYFLHGSCLDLHKKQPNVDDSYDIYESHNYNTHSLSTLYSNFSTSLHNATTCIPMDFSKYHNLNKEIVLKQLATWIHNDNADPNDLLEKLNGKNYTLCFVTLLDLLVVDKILLENEIITNFHEKLSSLVTQKFEYCNFSFEEMKVLKEFGYLDNTNFT